jgi:hypothetical protein
MSNRKKFELYILPSYLEGLERRRQRREHIPSKEQVLALFEMARRTTRTRIALRWPQIAER